MKKILVLLLLAAAGRSAAQPWQTIKGNGNIKKENRTVSAFTSVSSRGPIDVKISYGQPGSIQIEADENLLPYIETTVENGNLNIQSKKMAVLKSKTRMTVYVTMTEINALQLSGSGDMDGSGNFATGEKTYVKLSGSGNIHFAGTTFKELSTDLSGSGNAKVEGTRADRVSIMISGSGNVDCSSLAANLAAVKISGSGNARVYVNKSLNVVISGSGNVFYKGNATNILTKVAGSGKAIRME